MTLTKYVKPALAVVCFVALGGVWYWFEHRSHPEVKETPGTALVIVTKSTNACFSDMVRGTGYIVRERDAHAWCLVWNDATKSWEDFDTTPPSWVAIEGDRSSAIGEWFSDLRSWLGFQFAKFRWGQAHFQQYILWSLVPVLIVLLYYIIFRGRGRRSRAVGKNKAAVPVNWPGLDSEFYQLEKKLAARGVPRQTGEPLSEWLERALAEPAVASLRPLLRELLRLHYRHRFDPAGLDESERAALADKAKAALAELAQK